MFFVFGFFVCALAGQPSPGREFFAKITDVMYVGGVWMGVCG